MIDLHEIAKAVAEQLASNPNLMSVEIDTHGLSSEDILALIDAINGECKSADVTVKGIKVDPMQLTFPADAHFVNAFWRAECLVVVDLDLDDKLIVRRK